MQVKTCCGCWSLKSGSIAVAIIHMILMVAGVVIAGIITSDMERSQDAMFRSGPYYAVKAATVAVISYLLVTVSLSILLIIGAIKRNDKYVFPFVCLTFVSLIMSIAMAIGQFSFLVSFPFTPIQAFLIVCAIIVAVLALHYYMWVIPYSFYHQLVNEKFGHSGIKSFNDGVVYSKQLPPPYINDV